MPRRAISSPSARAAATYSGEVPLLAPQKTAILLNLRGAGGGPAAAAAATAGSAADMAETATVNRVQRSPIKAAVF